MASIEQANPRIPWNHNNHYHKFLLKQLPNHCQTALEIGCGDGEFSRKLAQRADQVIAIDLSPKMVKTAQQTSLDTDNIEFQVADIMEWEIPSEAFDAIVSIATVHHLPLEPLLPQLKAALKPGGTLIILDLVKHEHFLDTLRDGIAVPMNWVFQLLKNQGKKPTPEAIAALREHIRTDEYLTRSHVHQLYKRPLTNGTIRHHLFWRYSIVWNKR
jgi:SAM-dependent methyltransferase